VWILIVIDSYSYVILPKLLLQLRSLNSASGIVMLIGFDVLWFLMCHI